MSDQTKSEAYLNGMEAYRQVRLDPFHWPGKIENPYSSETQFYSWDEWQKGYDEA